MTRIRAPTPPAEATRAMTGNGTGYGSGPEAGVGRLTARGSIADRPSAPVAVMIDGRQVPLTSRQTKLRDRYMPNRPNDMPVQYRR